MLEFKSPILTMICIITQKISLLISTSKVFHPTSLSFGELNLKVGDQRQTTYHERTEKKNKSKSTVQNQAT